jgi:hypothetical protein
MNTTRTARRDEGRKHPPRHVPRCDDDDDDVIVLDDDDDDDDGMDVDDDEVEVVDVIEARGYGRPKNKRAGGGRCIALLDSSGGEENRENGSVRFSLGSFVSSRLAPPPRRFSPTPLPFACSIRRHSTYLTPAAAHRRPSEEAKNNVFFARRRRRRREGG